MIKRNERGFTLIELLIVIVIIGILAGVLVTVINPARQQNRARDGNVIATVNKAALAAKAHVASYGDGPNGAEFFNGLSSAAIGPAGAGCTAATDYCSFSITGNPLPIGTGADISAGCGANGYSGSSAAANAGQCYYRYQRIGTLGEFVIFAKSYGSGNVFMYDSVNSEVRECVAASATATNAGYTCVQPT